MPAPCTGHVWDDRDGDGLLGPGDVPLAGLRVRAVFLEVDEDNEPARRLYRRAGFREVARRKGYYQAAGQSTAALVLRRDL